MRIHLAIAGLAAMLAGPSLAASTIGIELNTLTQADSACRVTLVVRNALTVEISDVVLQVALFDKEGTFDRWVLLNTGGLTIDKSRVRQFDVPDLTCKTIGRILVNDVTECTGTGLTPTACLRALNLTSRAAIPLEQ